MRTWINHVAQPHRYAKAYESYDFRRSVAFLPEQLSDSADERVDAEAKKTAKRARWRVHLDYTIVKRERPIEKKIPGYKTHDSWRAIMEYKKCSRRTAFRLIAAGFKIPEGVWQND